MDMEPAAVEDIEVVDGAEEVLEAEVVALQCPKLL